MIPQMFFSLKEPLAYIVLLRTHKVDPDTNIQHKYSHDYVVGMLINFASNIQNEIDFLFNQCARFTHFNKYPH